MFRINKLTMYSFDEKKYTYQFSSGLNYFKGKNSSGKTEFLQIFWILCLAHQKTSGKNLGIEISFKKASNQFFFTYN